MEVSPTTKRANRWLLLALVIFAIGLCAFCLVWMRGRVAADGGRVYPPMASPSTTQTSCQRYLQAATIEVPFHLSFL